MSLLIDKSGNLIASSTVEEKAELYLLENNREYKSVEKVEDNLVMVIYNNGAQSFLSF